MTTRLNVMPFGTQVLFRCPRNPERECAADLRGMTGSGQTWENIGTDEKPTLMPSYNCTNGCGWHGYIVDGECVDAPPGISQIVACSSCRSPHLVRVAWEIACVQRSTGTMLGEVLLKMWIPQPVSPEPSDVR